MAEYPTLAQRYLLIGCAALGVVAIFALLYLNSSLKQRRAGVNAFKGDSEREEALLGSPREWQVFAESVLPEIAAWEPVSVKAIFRLNASERYFYLVNRKRVKDRHKRQTSDKNHSFEFPGGRVEGESDPVASLLRELEEEDGSGILPRVFADLLAHKTSGNIYFRNILLRNGEHHTVFRAPLEQKDWDKLFDHWSAARREHNQEVYGYFLLPLGRLDTSRDRHWEWTRKSIKILDALRS